MDPPPQKSFGGGAGAFGPEMDKSRRAPDGVMAVVFVDPGRPRQLPLFPAKMGKRNSPLPIFLSRGRCRFARLESDEWDWTTSALRHRPTKELCRQWAILRIKR